MTHLLSKKPFYTIIFLIVCTLFWACLNISCKPHLKGKNAKILVIHSFKKNLVSYSDMNKMITEQMILKGYNPELRVFYLNCDALGEEKELESIYQYIDTMKFRPEIILTTDDPATYSLLACKHPLVKEVPVVFTSVNFPNWGLLKEYPNVTGIWDKINYFENVEMIEKLMGYQRIRFYYDVTYIGRKILKELSEQLGNWDKELGPAIDVVLQNPDSIHIRKVECETYFAEGEELKSELKSTQFYFQNLRDQQGGTVLWYINGAFERSVSLLTRYDYTISRIGSMATIPTFSAVSKEFGYGQGILGGHFMTLEDQVEEGCEYLAQILSGKRISALPVKEGRKKSVLDWDEMERWNIKKSDVEKDFLIVNMPFYVEYQLALIISGVLFGGLIIFLISYLLFLFIRESKRKKHVQQILREEKEFLSLVLEGGNIFAWSYEHVGELFSFDRDFALSVGLKSEKITLDELVQITHPDDLDSIINQFIKIVNQKEDKATVPARLNFNGNGYIWYEFRMLGLPRREKSNVVVVGVILDIQNLKEYEHELIQARDLAAKTELKESFLANMSHEIRTPLNAIVGFSNILVADEDIDDMEKREYISTINTNCELLLKLINDILEISRIESGNLSFSLEPCSVNKLIEDIYQMNYLIVPSSISFIKETLAEDITIMTDGSRLKQVLVNMVNNALKFTNSGYIKIGIEYFREQSEISFYVEDTGIGIPAEEQKMIFERFYKRDEFAQGTGLGLSICNVIVEKLKGRITLKSEENKGSRFGIVLSYTSEKICEEDKDIEYITERNIPVNVDKSRPVILITEDSASNYMVLSCILKKYFTIIWALNGKDALDIVNNKHVDLVLMDIKMHEMDGITALKKIRKNHKNLPVIIQSAYAYAENMEQAQKAGCSDFLEKPIKSDVLLDVIAKYLPIKK